MKTIKNIIIILVCSGFFLTSCKKDEPRVIMAPGYEPTATDIPELFVDIGTAVPTIIPPTPTIPPLMLDNSIYYLPSNSLYFYPLVGWQIQTENPSYVKFDLPEKNCLVRGGA